MKTISIITEGNRSLYRSLYEAMDTQTNHRTVKAATRRIRRLNSQIKQWSKATGWWGDAYIEIDGHRLDAEETYWIWDAAEDPNITHYERDSIIKARLNQAIAALVQS